MNVESLRINRHSVMSTEAFSANVVLKKKKKKKFKLKNVIVLT